MANIEYAKCSIILDADIKLLTPIDSSVPCTLLKSGLSSGCDPENP